MITSVPRRTYLSSRRNIPVKIETLKNMFLECSVFLLVEENFPRLSNVLRSLAFMFFHILHKNIIYFKIAEVYKQNYSEQIEVSKFPISLILSVLSN